MTEKCISARITSNPAETGWMASTETKSYLSVMKTSMQLTAQNR